MKQVDKALKMEFIHTQKVAIQVSLRHEEFKQASSLVHFLRDISFTQVDLLHLLLPYLLRQLKLCSEVHAG